jgi:hypothetical protein
MALGVIRTSSLSHPLARKMDRFLMTVVPLLADDGSNKAHRFAPPDSTMSVSGVRTS